MQTIYVDFNTMQRFDDNNQHVVIAQIDNPRDYRICLREGERVIVYDEEFQVEALAHQQDNFWIGEIDWSTRKDVASSFS